MSLLISRKAEEDLAGIYSYLRLHRPRDVAERFRMAAEKALAQLGQHPELGPHLTWPSRHNHLRFWVIGRTRYILYYECQGDDVVVERVLDGRRDVRRIIDFGLEEEPPPEEEPGT